MLKGQTIFIFSQSTPFFLPMPPYQITLSHTSPDLPDRTGGGSGLLWFTAWREGGRRLPQRGLWRHRPVCVQRRRGHASEPDGSVRLPVEGALRRGECVFPSGLLRSGDPAAVIENP